MKTISLTTEVEVYQDAEELSFFDQKLIQAAKDICTQAYAPYSEFNVGAAILLNNGEIITGNNQENAAYPSGLCAERVAMFYANAQYPNEGIKAIAIIAMNEDGIIENPVAPCGACRQVLLESEIRFKQNYEVILVGQSAINKLKSSKDLLPLSFSGEGIKKGSR